MHKHKEFQKKPLTQTPPSREPLTPLNYLCMGPLCPSKCRKNPMHKEFQGGGLRVHKILYALIVCVFFLLSVRNSCETLSELRFVLCWCSSACGALITPVIPHPSIQDLFVVTQFAWSEWMCEYDWNTQTLSFLSLLCWNSLCFFCPLEDFLVFFERFPFFSRDFRGSVGMKILVFFVGFSLPFNLLLLGRHVCRTKLPPKNV